MKPLRAHVENGQIVLDEPMALPEGAEVRVMLPEDGWDALELTQEERAALEAEIDAGYEEIERGECVDADELFARLEGQLLDARR